MHNELLHAGIDGTYISLKLHFWWPSLYSDVRDFIQGCERCIAIKSDKHHAKVPLHPLPVVGLFQRLHVDHIGPIKVQQQSDKPHKFKHVLVLIDSYSSTCEL